MRIEIKKDMFNISKRVKQINKNYAIFYDFKKCRFELFDKLRGCVVMTLFKELNPLSLKEIMIRLNKSNFEILKEVETHNLMMEHSQLKEEKLKTLTNIENLLKELKWRL